MHAVARNVTTNDSGEYLIPGLPPSSYTLSVQAAGFEQFRVTDLELRATEKLRANAALVPGHITAELTVPEPMSGPWSWIPAKYPAASRISK